MAMSIEAYFLLSCAIPGQMAPRTMRISISSISTEAVFSFLSLGVRRSLCSKCPQVRRWHSSFAIRAQSVEFKCIQNAAETMAIVKIDDLTWSFRYYSEHPILRLELPNGRIVTDLVDIFDIEERLLEFYLNRERSEVHELIVEDGSINFLVYILVKIWNFSLRCGTSVNCGSRFFYYLKNQSFDRLDIQILAESWRALFFKEYSNAAIKCKFLSVKVARFKKLSSFLSINDNCSLSECKAKAKKLLYRCRSIQKFTVGSEYKAFLANQVIDIDGLWVKLMKGLNAKMKFINEVSGICAPIDKNKELFITRWKREAHWEKTYLFHVKVQESGKSVPYHQLSLRQKLEHWNYRRHELVHRILTNLEVPIVKWCLGVDLVLLSPKLIREHKNFDKVITISKVMMWLRHYHLLVLSVISQIIFFITASNPLSILVFVPFSVVFHYFCFRPFKTFQKSSLIICPPF